MNMQMVAIPDPGYGPVGRSLMRALDAPMPQLARRRSKAGEAMMTPAPKGPRPDTAPLPFTETRSHVDLDWRALCDAPPHELRAILSQAITHAHETGKELLLSDIARQKSGERPDPDAVNRTHAEIVARINEVTTFLGLAEPEQRLSLRGGMFDIRVYLGRARPTDYDY